MAGNKKNGHYTQELLLSSVSSFPKNNLVDLCDMGLREVEEISKKQCDFIGRTKCLLANLKSVQ